MVLYEFTDFQRNIYNVVDFCIVLYISYDFGVNHMFLDDFDTISLIFVFLIIFDDLCWNCVLFVKYVTTREKIWKSEKKTMNKVETYQKCRKHSEI